jgi:hypothetical protein
VAEKAKIEFPTAENWLLVEPLYRPLECDRDNPIVKRTLVQLEYYDRPIDSHCVECDRPTLFAAVPVALPVSRTSGNQASWKNIDEFFKGFYTFEKIDLRLHNDAPGAFNLYDTRSFTYRDRHFTVPFRCPRNPAHKLFFTFNMYAGQLTKVGQHPSLADLKDYDVRQYKKVLGEEKYREFTKAIGLTSHGIGIGAFVYLRRIFEGQIEQAHTQARDASDWDESLFVNIRIPEKIELLSAYLPDFLVENRSMYGILSKGIHDLSEEECLAHFEVLRNGIELILDQKLEAQERAAKTKKTSLAIAKIKGDLTE